MSSQQPETKFLLFVTIPEDLEPTNKEFIALAENYVIPDAEAKLRLNWKGLSDVVNGYKGDDLFVSGSGGNTINLPDKTASKLIEKLISYTLAVYGITIEADVIKTLTAVTQHTFDNLKTEVNGNITTSKNSWEYRILKSVVSPDTPEDVRVTVVSVKFEGLLQIEKKPLSTVTTENYSAAISSITYDVTRGFKNPEGGDEPQPKGKFYVDSKLPDTLRDSNAELVKFAERYVLPNTEGSLWLDWKKFKDDITAHGGDSLMIESAGSNTINQKEPNVDSLTQKILQHLTGAFQVTIDSAEVPNIKALIKNTFDNLKPITKGGVPDQTNAAEYRIIVATPNPDLADEFYSTVITVKVEGKVQEKPTGVVKNYSAVITHTKLVVSKDLEVPPA